MANLKKVIETRVAYMGKHRSLRKNYISRLLLLGLVVVTSLLAGSVVPIRRQAPVYLVGGVLQTVTESSIEIADASYEVPASNAIIVAKTGANTPHCGSIASPCLSIQYAVNKAPGGGSVVVRAGEYHEFVSINKPLTLQPYQNEKVWLKGSEEVTGWVQEGSVWRRDNWNYLWKTSGGAPIGAAISSNYIDDAHPMAGWPDMVFNDGISLTQVATKTEVSAGKFFVDYDTEQLYIGDDPAMNQIEAATLNRALRFDTLATGSQLKGIGVKQYASAVRGGPGNAVDIFASDMVIEKNTIAQSAGNGIQVNGNNAVVRGNTIVYNGAVGLGSFKTADVVVEQNYIAFNNFERFDAGWEASGTKMVTVRNAIIRENIFESNLGTGYWCDISCYNVSIVRNISRNNDRHGIFYEISSRGIIASNISAKNGSGGIQSTGSNKVDIYNNTLVENKRNIAILDEDRVNTKPEELAEGNDWNTHEVTVKNNILSNNDGTIDTNRDHGSHQVLVRNYATGEPTSDTFFDQFDYNAYYRTASDTPPFLIVYWSASTGSPRYWVTANTLADFQAYSKGYEQHGVFIDNEASNPWLNDTTDNDYRLKPSASVRKSGDPLPAKIAAAINSGRTAPIVTANTSIQRGAVSWASEFYPDNEPAEEIGPPEPFLSPIVYATVETVPAPNPGDSVDDIAIYADPISPSNSVIFATDKLGGIAVYDMEGAQLQYLADGSMNNVDVRTEFSLNGEPRVLVTATNRTSSRIEAYVYNPSTRQLSNVTGNTDMGRVISGYCMYRGAGGKIYGFVTNDSSSSGTVRQYELTDSGNGKVDATLVRTINNIPTRSEGCVVDDDLAHLYVAEEDVAIWKYGAEPGAGLARTMVDFTVPQGGSRLEPDIEGLAIYQGESSRGYLIASNQGKNSFSVYKREGANEYVGDFRIKNGVIDGVTSTEGIDVSSANLGPVFPAGVFIAQDGNNHENNLNFKLVPWEEIMTEEPVIPPASNDPALLPIADTYVSESSPTNVYGSVSPILVDGSPSRYALLKFDLADFEQKVVLSAKLRIYLTNGSPGSFGVYRAGDNWSETEVNFLNKPERLSEYATIIRPDADDWVEVDLTEAVIEQRGQHLSIEIASTGTDDGIDFISKEGTANKPILVVRLEPPIPPPHEEQPAQPNKPPVSPVGGEELPVSRPTAQAPLVVGQQPNPLPVIGRPTADTPSEEEPLESDVRELTLTIEAGTVFKTDRPTLTGTAPPGSKVEITVRSTPQVGIVTANSVGVWSFTPKDALEEGEHTYSARIINDDGSFGEIVGPISFSVAAKPIPKSEEINHTIGVVALILLATSGLSGYVLSRRIKTKTI